MTGYLGDVAALARKDLLLELRARDTLPAMLLFVVSVLVVFHFALPANASRLASVGLLWVAVLFTALLAYEHSLIKPDDLRRLDAAFFTVNGVISVAFFGFVLAEAAV